MRATLAASGSYYFGDSKQIGMKTAKIPMRTFKIGETTIVLQELFGFLIALFLGVEKTNCHFLLG